MGWSDGCDEIISFNDKDICFNQGIILRHKNDLVKNFEVFPNPTTGKIVINYHLKDQCKVIFSIYNLSSRKIHTFNLNSNESNLELDLSDLANGVYSYSVNSNAGLELQGKICLIK